MSEIRVHSKRLPNTQLLHDNETQTVNETVRLVSMPLEPYERSAFLVRRGPVNARQILAVEAFSNFRCFLMTDPAHKRDRFGHDVIGCQEPICRVIDFELTEDVENPVVVLILCRNQGENEPGIEKYHSRG